MQKQYDKREGFGYFPASHKVAVLCMVTEDEEREYETVFGVEWCFLKELWGFDDDNQLEYYLCNEYTSEDSQFAYNEAVLNNKLVFWEKGA